MQQQIGKRPLETMDIHSFEILFRQLYKPLCNYAFSFLKDHDESEEAVQSVFAEFWEKRNSVLINSSAKNYLYRMVRNKSLNKLKHEKVKNEYADDFINANAGEKNSVHEKVEAKELESMIRNAIEMLPQQCGLIFKMSRFEELKYAEIAGQLNLSVKTVENQMGKALRILRDKLSDFLLLILMLWKF